MRKVFNGVVMVWFVCALLVWGFALLKVQSPTVVHAQGANTWTIAHGPAAATQATVSKAAALRTIHFADCVTATLSTGASAPTAVQVNVVIRDGATGAGTIKWTGNLAVPATAGVSAAPISACGLKIEGTLNTAMTVEFAASGGANTIESVSLSGHTQTTY